jgi:hypothetical protein
MELACESSGMGKVGFQKELISSDNSELTTSAKKMATTVTLRARERGDAAARIEAKA